MYFNELDMKTIGMMAISTGVVRFAVEIIRKLLNRQTVSFVDELSLGIWIAIFILASTNFVKVILKG